MTRDVGRIVHVVDDEAGVRMSITDMIEAIGHQANSFCNGADLMATLDTTEPGCILLDIDMPGRTGLEILSDLSGRRCDWPVIAMTAHGDIPMAVQAMKSGAFDFLEKPFGPERLSDRLDKALREWVASRGRRTADDLARQRIRALTPRERDVLKGLSEGKQNKVLAYSLGLSIRTVEMHRANMLAKLGLKTAQEAVSLLLQSGMTLEPQK